MLEDWRVLVLEYLEYGMMVVLECCTVRGLECWHVGVLNYWSIGRLVCLGIEILG